MSIPLNHNTDTITPSTGTLAISGNLTVSGTAPAYIPTSITSTTTISNTTDTYVTPVFSIPANGVAAGATYMVTVAGTYTYASAGTGNITINLRLGTAGTTSDNVVVNMVSTCGTGSTNTSFVINAYVTFRSLGSSGTSVGSIVYNGDVGLGLLATYQTRTAAATSTTNVNTTATMYIGMSIQQANANTITITEAFVGPA